MSQDNSHNDAISLLILWGREHFFHPENQDLKAIESDLRILFSGEKQGSGTDLSGFESRVDDALSILKSELTLNLNADEAMDANFGLISPEDPNFDPEDKYYRVNSALQVLDEVVYLNHALHHLPEIEFSLDKKDEVLNILDRIVTDERPNALRLIPMNALRHDFIKSVPEDLRYLFPWYEEWSEMAENSLTSLALGLAGYDVTEDKDIGIEDFNRMWVDLQTDPIFLKEVMEKANFIKAIPATIKEAYAMRWIIAADEIASELVMPDNIAKVGALNAAIKAAVNYIIAGEHESFKFFAAFCGLGLDREQRYQLLRHFEDALKNRKGIEGLSFYNELDEWQSNKKTDKELAEIIISRWAEMLSTAAREVQGWVDENLYWQLLSEKDPRELAQKIGAAQAQSYDPVDTENVSSQIVKALKKIRENVISENFSYYFNSLNEKIGAFAGTRQLVLQPAQFQGIGAQNDAETLTVDCFYQKVPMPSGKKLLSSNEKETKDLQGSLKESIFYLAGFAITDEGQIDKIDIQRGSVPFNIEKEASSYRSVLLAISGSREVLENVFSEKQDSGGSAENTGVIESSGIGWILYVREENSSEF